VIRALAEPAEAMPSVADGSMEVVLSNAVLEHVRDVGATMRELRRVSAPGAWHFHQVDFCDHRNRAQPLEHLLEGAEDFAVTQVRTRWERGCQWRLSDLLATVEAAGFQVVAVHRTTVADPAYLAGLKARLAASDSPYRHCSDDDLEVLDASLILRAP
jgi:ubiquinone/menaquinone biosynthesis C-methylase UbiE